MHAGQAVCMKIAERTAVWRRERRVLLRVSRAAWRLEQAERECSWALASARAEGMSTCALAAAAGLSSSRVHQIVAAADLDALAASSSCVRTTTAIWSPISTRVPRTSGYLEAPERRIRG